MTTCIIDKNIFMHPIAVSLAINIIFIVLHSQALEHYYYQSSIWHTMINRRVFQSYLYESRAHPNTNKVIPTEANNAKPTIAVNRKDQHNENASILEHWHIQHCTKNDEKTYSLDKWYSFTRSLAITVGYHNYLWQNLVYQQTMVSYEIFTKKSKLRPN